MIMLPFYIVQFPITVAIEQITVPFPRVRYLYVKQAQFVFRVSFHVKTIAVNHKMLDAGEEKIQKVA